MLNPSDLMRVQETGDDDVGDSYAYSDQPGETRDQSKLGYSRGEGHIQQQSLLPLNDPIGAGGGQLAANGQNSYRSPYTPDMFFVTVPNIAGVTVELAMGVGNTNPVLARLGPGGAARVLGTADAITLTNITAVACFPVVVALAGSVPAHPADYTIAPGGTATK